jgi:hypothetical protein
MARKLEPSMAGMLKTDQIKGQFSVPYSTATAFTLGEITGHAPRNAHIDC